MQVKEHRYAVIVAGGSGTRLWPLSRQELPKQVQKLISDKTLIEETADRLSGIVDYDHIFVSTTENHAQKIAEILPKLPVDNIIVEPVARGTTAAFALFAESIRRRDPEAVIVSLASDHAVSDVEIFHDCIEGAFDFVEKNPTNIALIGVKPSSPDTSLGYVKIDKQVQADPQIFSVEKFVEKPSLSVAKTYFESGEYYWNAAYYCFRAETLVRAYEEADPEIMQWTLAYIDSGNKEDFDKVPKKVHEIEIINAGKFPLALVPAYFQWSDIGSWGALHELLAKVEGNDDMMVLDKDRHIDFDSTNSMVVSKNDKKIIATVGLRNLVIVDTDDALLVLDKSHTQDIKQVLEMIKVKGLSDYL